MALRNLIILSEAEQDVAQAYVWYDDQEFGLGEEFLSCGATLPLCHFLGRFSSKSYYLRCFYCSQGPKKWRSRLP